MNLKKIVDYSLIGLALVFSIFFFFLFDLEDILWKREERHPVSLQEIKEGEYRNHIGEKAGEGITMLKTKDDWDKVINEVDYVSVIPKSIVKTDVYSLAKWADHYTRRSNGTTSRKKAEVRQTIFDVYADYSPYYIIELEDGTCILAQMNRGIANRIKKGEKIELPLGKKIGFSSKAKELLKTACNKWDVDDKYVLYTIDDEWEKEKANRIFIEKWAISFGLFLVLAVVLQLIVDKIVFPDSEEEN